MIYRNIVECMIHLSITFVREMLVTVVRILISA